jgi:hypothetical protein
MIEVAGMEISLVILPFLAIVASALLFGCETAHVTSLPVSKTDRTTQRWGDTTNYGPRQHYVHVVRDQNGDIKDVYRYYLDERGKPVLDGDRIMYRWKHDPGLFLKYRDGRLIKKGDVIVKG